MYTSLMEGARHQATCFLSSTNNLRISLRKSSHYLATSRCHTTSCENSATLTELRHAFTSSSSTSFAGTSTKTFCRSYQTLMCRGLLNTWMAQVLKRSFFLSCLTLVQVLIGIFDRTSILFRRSLQELGNICGVKEALPKSYTLQESLLGCVYEGTFDGAKVRIRRVKMYPGGDPQKVKEVCTRCHVPLFSETHEFHRHSIKWLRCRNT